MAFIPALCEVTYDSDLFDRDRYSTPYRVPQLSSLRKVHYNGGIGREYGTFGFDRLSMYSRNTAPSYYDYLRSYYLEQSCSTYGSSVPSPCLPQRSQTTFAWYVPVSEDANQTCYRDEHREVRDHQPFPTLLQSPRPVEERGEGLERDSDGGRLIWVDALNSWVPHKRLQGKNYLSFVKSPPVIEKYYPTVTREALQKKASSKTSPDIASRKENRKAYSTPLSNAESRRKSIDQFHRAQTPDLGAEAKFSRWGSVQPAWTSSDSLEEGEGEEEGEGLHDREGEGEEEERLELQVPEADTEAVDSGQVVDTSQGDLASEEQGRSASHSSDYLPIPRMYLTPTLPQLPAPTLRPIYHRESSATSQVSSETVDTVPTLPSVSIQYVVSESHHHAKAVHFPMVVATNMVEMEPVSEKVPYRVERFIELEEEDGGTGIWRGHGQQMGFRRKPGQVGGKAKDFVDTSLSDRTPPDKSHVRVAETGRQLTSHKRPKPPSHAPPISRTKTQTQIKKTSPKKTVMSKPSKTPTKTGVNKVNKPSQQRQKPVKSTAKHKKATKGLQSKPVKLDKPPSSGKSSQDEYRTDRPQQLPVSLPVVTAQPPPSSSSPSPSSSEETVVLEQETEIKSKGRSKIKKRERVVNRRPCKTEEVITEPEPPEFPVKKSSWIYDKEEPETQTEKRDILEVKVEQPVLPSVASLPSVSSQASINRIQKKLQAFRQPIDKKKKWGPKKRDTSYEDEVRKQELAEERRKRQADKLERLKKKRIEPKMEEPGINGLPRFEDYGFLSKYCIFSRANVEMFKHAFQAVDDENRGWLTGTEAMIALRGTNNHLTETEEEYLYRIMELTGYKIANGADFKLFSVIAALSQRIATLDHWMKNIIGRLDFKTLEMKMFMCKSLWECNVDPNTNKISLDQLMIELRAGGVSYQHECEVREKLGHLDALDLLDFLTYVPLFIMIHESVVDNPLDDSRDK